MHRRSTQTTDPSFDDLEKRLVEKPSVVYVAIDEFKPISSFDLRLSVGDEVKVTAKDDNGFWYGESIDGQRRGLFSSRCVLPKGSKELEEYLKKPKSTTPSVPKKPGVSRSATFANSRNVEILQQTPPERPKTKPALPPGMLNKYNHMLKEKSAFSHSDCNVSQ